MKEFDILWGYIDFDEGSDGKDRPIVVIDFFNSETETLVYPVYSYRSWFMDDVNSDRFFEILDLTSAGLNQRSFIDISRDNIFPNVNLLNLRKLGKLSDNDIERLLDFIEQYL